MVIPRCPIVVVASILTEVEVTMVELAVAMVVDGGTAVEVTSVLAVETISLKEVLVVLLVRVMGIGTQSIVAEVLMVSFVLVMGIQREIEEDPTMGRGIIVLQIVARMLVKGTLLIGGPTMELGLGILGWIVMPGQQALSQMFKVCRLNKLCW
jgi:hypothetical protein